MLTGYVDGAKWMAPKDWDPEGAMRIDFGGDQKPIEKICKEVRRQLVAAAAAAAAADATAGAAGCCWLLLLLLLLSLLLVVI
eukprot:COSAG06_NODE_30916_length_530_cov_0.733179_1_plen_81_part_01